MARPNEHEFGRRPFDHRPKRVDADRAGIRKHIRLIEEDQVPHSIKNWIVETDWLATHLHAPDLVVFDGSWHLPQLGRDARQDYLDGHIPGALFFDIDDIADDKSTLPHMLPSTVKFASRMKKMGVGDGMRIVVYDSLGIYSAPRVWWTFRVMGHEDVAVLNGGLLKWKAEGRDIESGEPMKRSERHYTPRFNAELVRDIDDMRSLLSKPGEQIVDVRPTGRFVGRDPEPREGLRGGHIPGSFNIPFTSLVTEAGTLRSKDELARIFADAGVDTHAPVIATCGSGVNASIVSLALAVLGQTNAAVYDGSWAEWGKDNGLPVATVTTA